MRHPPNLSPDQLNPRKRREGHAGRETVAGCLGEVPAVLPLQGSKQALKISQGASARLRAPKLRGNPPSNRLQLLSPVLGFAPARHGTAPPPPQAEQRAKPGCSTNATDLYRPCASVLGHLLRRWVAAFLSDVNGARSTASAGARLPAKTTSSNPPTKPKFLRAPRKIDLSRARDLD